MKELYEGFCETPEADSNKAKLYAKAIEYLCDYLGVSGINAGTLDKIKGAEEYVSDKNSTFYKDLLEFLTARGQELYLENGVIEAALKPFLDSPSIKESFRKWFGMQPQKNNSSVMYSESTIDAAVRLLEHGMPKLGIDKYSSLNCFNVTDYEEFKVIYDDCYSSAEAFDKKQNHSDFRNGLDFYLLFLKELAKSENGALDFRETVYEVTVIGGEKEMTIKEQIEAIKAYIAVKRFNYDGNLIENFYLSLKSKPFVILAGTSGTGKTKLVNLFAQAIGANVKTVPVRPDWSDSSDLFGHIDLSGNFQPGAIIDFISDASKQPEIPFILCLDEMNLARVEYYMSDILSVIETREFDANHKITSGEPLVSENDCRCSNGINNYGEIRFPGNLYIVGTVNMDETTFPFSKKVLDRANTIEFSFVDLEATPAFRVSYAQTQSLQNSFLVSEYITLNDCSSSDEGYIKNICAKLQRINNVLERANAHIGYRVRDEIVFYMLNNKKADLLDENSAFDNQIMQKILPRIQGSSESIKTMLGELLKLCESENYKASTKKISFMIKRYEEDGFTSYWL